ncbi:hypothetical protein HYT25_01650 [Candidatus Pacearchaeota archaeon]|nr:hypothetical protein [Candidatus Pacearchaeota archaeon]
MTPEPFVENVHFDGKHWIGKKRPDERLQIHSYKHVAQQARRMLGRNGIVAIPNARQNEYRFEELILMGEGYGLLDLSDEKKFFYDPVNAIYIIKAQEVRTRIDSIPIVLLAYNLPFGTNLSNKNGNQTLEEAAKYNCILGINMPSCIDDIDAGLLVLKHNIENKLGHFDFVVGYAGGAALRKFGGANNGSQNLYRDEIKDKDFENPFTKEKHKIGIIAVSGGHRTPYGRLENALNGGQTIGSSYTEIPEPNQNNFMNDLRQSLRNSNEASMHCEPIIIESVKSQLSIKVGDRIRNLFFR